MEDEVVVVDGMVAAGHLEADRRSEVITALARQVPTKAQWGAFLHLAGLSFGTASVLGGIIYLVAFNWEALGIVTKLGLAFGALLLAAGGAVVSGPRTLPGQLLTIAAAVLAGSCLVIYTQVYQSGANAWTLFATWTALAMPFVLAARTPALWALAVVLVDATVFAYLSVHDAYGAEPVAGLAVVHVLVAEAFRGNWLQHALRLVGIGALTVLASIFAASEGKELPIAGSAALTVLVFGGLGVQAAFLVRKAGAPAAALSYSAVAAVVFSFIASQALDIRAEALAMLLAGGALAGITAMGFLWVVGVPRLRRGGDGGRP